MVKINQYDIIIVNLEPTIGSEIKKIRPCVVISPNEMNLYLNTIVVAPMTTTLKKYPTRIGITFEGKEGWIAIDQIRTIDVKRVVKTVGRIDSEIMTKVKDVIREAFVL